jgi:hypothetical protein
MELKKYKMLEAPHGVGKVYKDDREIARVNYQLQIKQEFIIEKSSSGEEETPGLKEITGQINIIEGERNLIDGSVLTLYLSDNRKWQFFTNRGNPISGNYVAVNVDGEGLI